MPSAPVTTVGEVMTRTVVAVGPEAPFQEIVETMERWKVSALPVLAGDGRVVGMVSGSDLLPEEEHRGRMARLRRAGSAVARELMTAPAVSVQPAASPAQAARIMAHRQLKRLPVVDGEGRLMGIVSRADLLKVFLRTDEEITEEVREQVLRPLLPGGGPPAVRAHTEDGVVVFTGRFPDASLIPLAVRMARSVEGVVDVRLEPEDAAE